MQYDTLPMPQGLLQATKALPYADHIFGTRDKCFPDINETIRTFTERVGPIAHMRQVHGDRIEYAHTSGLYEECDAIFTDHPNLWLGVKSADCLPILISSPAAVAVVHGGWRGLEAEILPKTLELLMDEFNVGTNDLFVHVGPHISQPFYEVEERFADLFGEEFCRKSEKDDKVLLNMGRVARRQAMEVGLTDLNIHVTDHCTFSQPELFHSYRRHKQGLDSSDYAVQLSLIRLNDKV